MKAMILFLALLVLALPACAGEGSRGLGSQVEASVGLVEPCAGGSLAGKDSSDASWTGSGFFLSGAGLGSSAATSRSPSQF